MRIMLAAAVVLGEVLVVGAWVSSGNASIVVMVQVLILAILAVLILGSRIVQLRGEHLHQLSLETAARERARIAEEMHDALGHELSLIAMQAGALQLTHPETAERSAEIREGAARATLALREIVAVWPAGSTSPVSVNTDLSDILKRSSAAGMVAREDISGLKDAPLLVRDTVTRVVREALTNASRYGSGPAEVTVRRDGINVAVDVSNPAAESRRTGRGRGAGLVQLQRRVVVLGGTFEANQVGEHFLVRASLPVQPAVRSSLPPAPVQGSLRRRWALSVVGPAVLVALVDAVYYVWAVHDAAADQATLGRIQPGMTQSEALSILPARDAPVRFSSSRPPEGADLCRYVTNGNFPLGYATWRVCFDHGVVLGVDDIR